jgi:putative FmdB family regulatory protein
MPIFEYRCLGCEKVLEILQKQGEGPRRKCPECGDKLEKLVSRTAFHLKGGGWYDQGYEKSRSKSASSSKPSGKGSDSGKSSKKAKSPKSPAPKKD